MEATTTEAMQRALDALLDGNPIPSDAQARLTDAERAEIAALAATANLTRLVLHAPEPPPRAEASSLLRAQGAVRSHPPLPDAKRVGLRDSVASWLARLRKTR